MFRTTIKNLSTKAHAAVAHQKIGFIGLGNMGGPMARNLAVKGHHDLVVFDVSQDRIDWLKSESGSNKITKAASPAEVASDVKYVVTMLPSNPHVLDVYTNPKTGILSTCSEDSLFLDSSTIDPNVARQVAEKVQAQNCTYLDAPVSGGVTAAAAGTLTFMVGNNPNQKEKYDEAYEILEHMAGNVRSLTGVGNGQVAKICNNMMLGVQMIVTAEAYNMGEKLGMDPKELAGIVNISSGRCWSSDTYNPVPGVIPGVPSNNNWNGGFGSALMLKDLGLAQDASKSVDAPTPLGGHAQQIYSEICQKGYAEKDFGSVYKYFNSNGNHFPE
jgi:3-hydroxyisobutyrate dehydrogenase